MSEQAERDVGNSHLRANSLEELLAWNDANFIRCAFVTMIGRQPDDEGEAFYLERLRRGHSKLDLLWQLRRSREGRAHDPGIRGLDRALKRAAWERMPVVGALVRAVTAGEADNRLIRSNRALLNELRTIKEALGEKGQHLTNLTGKAPNDIRMLLASSSWAAEGDLSAGAQKSFEIISRKITR